MVKQKYIIYLAVIFALPCKAQVTNTNANISILSGTFIKLIGTDFVNQSGGAIINNGNLELQNDITNNGSFVSGNNSNLVFSGTNQEIKGSNDLDIRNLKIDNGATLTINKDVSLKGNLENNGTFNASGTTVFNGSALQTISGNSTTTFNNLTIGSSGVSLSAPVEVKRLLTLTGNLTTNNQPFTLLSDASGTAMVVNSGGVVNGTATMQRYINPAINAGAGYRHYSSPVVSTTVNDLATAGFTPKVNTAFNALPTPNISLAAFPNIFEYDQSRISATYPDFGTGWKSPAALNATLQPGKGYDVQINASAKVDFQGTLNNGNITVSNLGNGGGIESGWHLLGNPYPAPIDWNLLSKPSGMNNALYVYRSTSAYNGTYSSYINGVGAAGANLIPAMQGFFVRNTSASPINLNFTNAARLTSYANPNFYRTSETRPLLQLNLKDGQNREDAAHIYFEQGATSSVDNAFDAYKVLNTDGSPNLYSRAGNTKLSINGLPLLSQAVVVPLGTLFSQGGTYVIETARLLNFTLSETVMLEDRKLNAWHNLKSNLPVSFTATVSDTSRFFLHFNRNVNNLTENIEEADVQIYPNPASSTFQLDLTSASGATNVEISNAIGQLVWNKTVAISGRSTVLQVDASRFSRGVYQVKVQTEKGLVVKKVVIQ